MAFGSQARRFSREQRAEMRKEAVSARTLLSGDVKDRFNLIRRVSNLILDENSDRVKYVIWEVPYPYSGVYLGRNGFVEYDAIDLEHGVTGRNNLVVEETESEPERGHLTIARSEARYCSLDHIIGSEIEFADGTERQVQDVLVHPETGKVTHYVVAMNPDDLWDGERRTIRADNVKLREEGQIQADLEIEELEEQQDFDSRFLG
jgi:hypothetical protein